MKTKPMTHQVEGLRRLSANPERYALGCEQGTGKTWMLLADAEKQFAAGRINALFIIAPKGVHTNWIISEIPKHLAAPHQAEFWLSGAGKRHTAKLEKLFRTEGDELVILAMNVDAVNTKKGFEFAMRFVRKFKAMIVVDESQRIKNTSAKRTKRVHSLAPFSPCRRIASGTLIPNTPLDLFGQYEFLGDGLLGTTSFRAFTAEFAEVLPQHHPLVQQISSRVRGSPQIIKRDRQGNPIFRNLEKLQSLMAPYTYRVLKKDCLDLPEKVYKTFPFDLNPAQRRLYESVKEDMRYLRDDGTVDIFSALTCIGKLQQMTSGFIMVDGEPSELSESGPRIAALKEVLEDCEWPVIIFATFREEIRQLVAELSPDHTVAQYHGGTSPKDRVAAIDGFQNGDVDAFIGNPAAAGTGLTLTAARTVIYYSCSFNLEQRLQSEDRAHRIGTHWPVVYVDLVARDTIDERIAGALQTKEAVAAAVLDGL